jgi:hypothetical protein
VVRDRNLIHLHRNTDIEQLKDVVGSMESFGKTKELIAKHVSLCNDISSVFARRGLEPVVDLEQRLALTESNNSKFGKLLQELQALISDPHLEYNTLT